MIGRIFEKIIRHKHLKPPWANHGLKPKFTVANAAEIIASANSINEIAASTYGQSGDPD